MDTKKIFDAVVNGDIQETQEGVNEALASNVPAEQILHEALIPAMTEVGCLFAPTAQGRGYGYESLRALCDYAFTTGGVRRLTASVTAGNEASKQLLLKAGFRLEGELRENYWLNGRWHNDWLFGRLRGEGDAP